jgi:hypothetical protein
MNERKRAAMASRRPIGPVLAVVAIHALALAPAATADRWPRAYIAALPDEAFAVVHVRPNGTKSRHLPHHGADGRVDVPHLRNALARLSQVRWEDPADAERARKHLQAHEKGLGLRQRPTPRPAADGRRCSARKRLEGYDRTQGLPGCEKPAGGGR